MKKALSLLIAFAMLFSLGITANAAEKKEDILLNIIAKTTKTTKKSFYCP